MLYASVQRNNLVVAVERFSERGVLKCVCVCRWPLHENKDVHVLPQITWYLFSLVVWTSQPEGARVPNRMKPKFTFDDCENGREGK